MTYPVIPPPGPPTTKTSGLTITAFVLACLIFLPFVPIVGGILGIVATARHKPGQGGKGLAIAAIVVGFCGFFFTGILAAVAIPAFMKYTQRSKSSEARMVLRKLEMGAKHYAAENEKFPIGTTDWVPERECCGQPQDRCAVDMEQWSKEPWMSLSFDMDMPSRYQVRYVSDGDTVTIEARGDLDCDMSYSSFTTEGAIESGYPRFTGMMTERELE